MTAILGELRVRERLRSSRSPLPGGLTVAVMVRSVGVAPRSDPRPRFLAVKKHSRARRGGDSATM
jgi:hypothetical protein